MQWLTTSICSNRLLHARQNVPVLRLVGPRRGQLIPRAKMTVPPIDGFGSQSPEKKAAVALRSLFTFVAARWAHVARAAGQAAASHLLPKGHATERQFLQGFQ